MEYWSRAVLENWLLKIKWSERWHANNTKFTNLPVIELIFSPSSLSNSNGFKLCSICIKRCLGVAIPGNKKKKVGLVSNIAKISSGRELRHEKPYHKDI